METWTKYFLHCLWCYGLLVLLCLSVFMCFAKYMNLRENWPVEKLFQLTSVYSFVYIKRTALWKALSTHYMKTNNINRDVIDSNTKISYGKDLVFKLPSHSKGRSPVCVRWCISRYGFLQNAAGHKSHRNGRFPTIFFRSFVCVYSELVCAFLLQVCFIVVRDFGVVVVCNFCLIFIFIFHI